MLDILIEGKEMFDEKTQTFSTSKSYTLSLEHSLLSISKWESKFEKPFLEKNNQASLSSITVKEFIEYIKCMTVNKNVPNDVYDLLTNVHLKTIKEYMDSPMTATKINSRVKDSQTKVKTTTNELVYYWMFTLGIPIECEKWHLNRLLMLINVCNVENNPKKMTKKEAADYTRNENARRRKQYAKKK